MDGLSYRVGTTIFLTYAGMVKVAQLSENPQAIKNREKVLVLLKQKHAELRSTMHVSTSAAPARPVPGPSSLEEEEDEDEMIDQQRNRRVLPYNGQKKACLDGALAPFVLEDEERQVAVIRKQRNEMELLLPVIRVKNEEEIQHIQNVKTAQAEQLQFQLEMQQKINEEQRKINAEEIEKQQKLNAEELEKQQKLNTEQRKINAEEIEKQQKLNAEALLYKDATQDRDRIERESLLQYKRAELELEKERRMVMDPDYKVALAASQQPVPVTPVYVNLPIMQPIASDLDAAIKLKTEQDAVKKANTERALKGAATRRQKREIREKERIELVRARDRANHAARIARMDAEALKNQTPHQRNMGMSFLDV